MANVKTNLKVLQVVGGLPTVQCPWIQPFVSSQVESLRKIGLDLDVLNLSESDRRGWKKYLGGIFELRDRIKAKTYGLIHAHYSYCGWVSRFQHGIPVIVSLMGDDLTGTVDGCGQRTFRGKIDASLTKILTKIVDHVIVKSEKMAKLISRNDIVSVVPNGVDLELFKPMDRSYAREYFALDLKQKVILFPADPEDSRKNYALAQGAIRVLQARSAFPCFLWVFWRHRQAEVAIAMNAADVLLVTSFSEGSPNIIKEAMACNLPIVSVRVGDVAEVTSGSQNCYLADYDPLDIASRLEAVLKSNARSDGRQHIEHLRLEAVAARLVAVYDQVLKRKGSVRMFSSRVK
jgi:glycosyltransferase involved in cell wall biosynthesis